MKSYQGDDVSDSKETPIIPIHQWTNGGDEVLVVRFVSKNGKSYGGFRHPMTVGEAVTAPDWRADCTCGGGIHAWPWALGLGEGKDCDWSAVWQVYGVKPEDIMHGAPDLVGKIKFKSGVLRFIGNWWEATNFVFEGRRLCAKRTWKDRVRRYEFNYPGRTGSAALAAAVQSLWARD